jgi:hypothetical protein
MIVQSFFRPALRTIQVGFCLVAAVPLVAAAQAGGRGDAGHGDGVAHDIAKIRADCGSAWQPPCPADHSRGQLEDPKTGHATGAAGSPVPKLEPHGEPNGRVLSSRSRDLIRPQPHVRLESERSVSANKMLSRRDGVETPVPLPVRRVGSAVELPAKISPGAPKAVVGPAPVKHVKMTALQQSAALAKPTAALSTQNSLVLAQNNGSFVGDCAHRDVTILANNGHFVLSGGCQSLTVSGSNNKVLVELASGGELDVLRQSNSVAWAKVDLGADPVVLSAGKANATASLSPTQPVQQPDPGADKASSDPRQLSNTNSFSELSTKIPSLGDLIIVATDGDKTVRDCANKDVAISAHGGTILLTGGCRSVTVSGSANKVFAEIANGGELSVLQFDNAVAWIKVGTGTEPVAVHAEGSNRAVEMIPADGRADVQKGAAP